MHTAYIRPGGVSFDTYRIIKRYYDFLEPFSKKLTEWKNFLMKIAYLKNVLNIGIVPYI